MPAQLRTFELVLGLPHVRHRHVQSHKLLDVKLAVD